MFILEKANVPKTKANQVSQKKIVENENETVDIPDIEANNNKDTESDKNNDETICV